MNRYFDLKMLYDDAAFSILGREVSFSEPDRFCLDDWIGDPDLYFSNLEFSIKQNGTKQGFLANNLGWIILDTHRLKIENKALSPSWKDIHSWELPTRLTSLDSELLNYRIIGFKQKVECIDFQQSDLTLETTEEGLKYISSVRKLALKEEKIQKFNLFRIAEYPSIPVISEKIYAQLISSNLSGWGVTEIELTTQSQKLES
jgi:hypothetical protein